jgi:hypothetical protein
MHSRKASTPKKPQLGVNDLASQRPDIAKELNPALNKGLTARDVTRGSQFKMYWMKECDSAQPMHVWCATVNDRTNKSGSQGCAVCRGKQLQVGVNDLQSKYPDIAQEWNPALNKGLTAERITYASRQEVYWMKKCYSDQPMHVWHAPVKERTTKGRGCAVCNGKQVQVGINDLASRYPALMGEWNYAKNAALHALDPSHPAIPQNVTYGSEKQVWWTCRQDSSHVWRTAVDSRTGKDSGCPDCADNQIKDDDLVWMYLAERNNHEENRREGQVGITRVGVEERFRTGHNQGVPESSRWEVKDSIGPFPGKVMKETERQMRTVIRERGWNVDQKREIWEVIAGMGKSYDSLADVFADFGVTDPRDM